MKKKRPNITSNVPVILLLGGANNDFYDDKVYATNP